MCGVVCFDSANEKRGRLGPPLWVMVMPDNCRQPSIRLCAGRRLALSYAKSKTGTGLPSSDMTSVLWICKSPPSVQSHPRPFTQRPIHEKKNFPSGSFTLFSKKSESD